VQRARSASRIGGRRFASPSAASRTTPVAAAAFLGVPLRPHARRPLELAPLGGRIDAQQLDALAALLLEGIHPDDDALACLDLLLELERCPLDLLLHEAALDGRDGSAHFVHPLDQLPCERLELVGQRLEEVGAAERVGRVGRAGLGREDLLRA